MSHDLTIDEKRVYGDRTGAVEVLVATARGVVAAAVSDDRVGEFRLDHRGDTRDVAVDGERRAVATDEDVLVGDYDPTGFGPARAVGFADGDLLAAGTDGRVARLGTDGWTTVGTVGDPRAVDAGLVAAADGVHRVVGGGLDHVGLDDARDVHGRGLPFAATGAGLYRLGNGWMDERAGAFDAVSAADGRVHAVGEGGVVEREGVGAWTRLDLPVDGRVVDVGHTAAATLAVTDGGTLLTSAGHGSGGGDGSGNGGADGSAAGAGDDGTRWRATELGVDGVRRLAAGTEG